MKEVKSSSNKNVVDAKLLKAMGISESQITLTTTAKKVNKPTTELEKMKLDAKTKIQEVNASNGQNVRFSALVRNGKTSDGKDAYKMVNHSGDYLISKNEDGTFTASKIHYYTENFKIADYTIIGSNSDLKK